jgi:hypothetical protein
MNLELFATALIKGLNLPVTNNRLKIFYAWFNAEGTQAKYNPLATTWETKGSTFFNCLKKDSDGNCKVGVQNYPNANTGIDKTIDTLKLKFYEPIVEALKNNTTTFNANDKELKQAFATWGTGYNNFLNNFKKYGKVTGKQTKTDKATIKPLGMILFAATAYGIYKYNK